MTNPPDPAPAETRDWTVVLDEGCEECRWQPFDPAQAAHRLDDAAIRWGAAMARPGTSQRPSPLVWSPVEYACHARDMVRLLGERTQAILEEDDPQFADWDGDAATVELAYWSADPADVARSIADETARTVAVLDAVRPQQWDRRGHRSDGKEFTIASLSLYLVHDVEHHLHDVGA